MRKKVALWTIVLFAVIAVAAPMGAVEAAGWGDLLSQAGIIKAADVEKVAKAEEALKARDKDALFALLASVAADQLQKRQPVYGQLPDRADLENFVRQEMESKVREKLAGSSFPLGQQLEKLLELQSILLPQAVQDSNTLTGAPENYRKVLDMTATAYGPDSDDNGQWGGRTYTGTKVRKGVAAVDPTVIPLGTKLYVEGYGYAVAEDQGSAIKGNRIDLAFDTRQEALNYGIQNVKVYLLN